MDKLYLDTGFMIIFWRQNNWPLKKYTSLNKLLIDVNDSMLGLNNGDSLMVEAKAALQQENTLTRRTEVLPLDAIISGIIKKIDGIKIKSGAKIESNFELSVNYYKLTIGGRTVVELDVFNRISNVNGKTNDTIRRILGLL